MHVHSDCFCSLNRFFCGFLVAVVVANAPPNRELNNNDHDEVVNDNEKYAFLFMRSFPIIPTCFACEMCSNCPGFKLE